MPQDDRPARTGFVPALVAALGDRSVSVDPADLQAYGRDWTRVFAPAPCAVAFPDSTEAVVRAVQVCRQFGVPIVPSGGRTGLAAGAVAMHGELVLSLQRMRRIGPIDVLGQTVRVQAGAVTQDVHDAAAAEGLTWPIDLASKGSSTIGGNVATNAGGVRVIRYGHTRHWVLGLQVVTAAGDVLELGGALEKDNTGLDLKQLFIGSEGTLGIVTEATLALTRRSGPTEVLLLGLDSLEAVLALFGRVRQLPCSIEAFEFFTDFCIARVVGHRGVPWPLQGRPPCYALLELRVPPDLDLDACLQQWLDEGLVRDGTRATTTAQGRELWRYRESITESLAPRTPHKNDIALPVAGLAAFVAELETTWHAERRDWELALFGHVGDGNLHLNALRPEAMAIEDFRRQTAQADRDLFALVQRHGGSISAEHGIGLVKKDYLAFSRGPAEVALQRAVKRAIDPENLLNPGKIFDL